MKKYIIISLLLFLPLIFKASFDTNLKYGNKGEAVKEVQEFLTDQGYYSGPITGNFFSLTLKGVKNFQEAKKLKVTGVWGQNERTSANQVAELDSSNTVALDTPTNSFHFMDWPGSAAPPTIPTPALLPIPLADVCLNIQGSQTYVPSGMVADGQGNCVVPVLSYNPTPTLAPTSTPTPAPTCQNSTAPNYGGILPCLPPIRM